MRAIIIDLDGTLCDPSQRRHFVESKPKDYKKFYDNLINDKINVWCLRILEKFADTHEVLLVSGRPDNYRKLTERWLGLWNVQYKPENLLMRKEGDYREDFIIKQEIYDNSIKGKYIVEFAVDDRKQVVDMWRENNIVCLQCANGDF